MPAVSSTAGNGFMPDTTCALKVSLREGVELAMKRFVLLLVVCAMPCLATDSFHLAEGGRVLAPILISPEASEQTKAVATELAAYLRRITGAEFEVKAGAEQKGGIFLAVKDTFPIRNTYDGREAYSIVTDEDGVHLTGATDMAVSHAAFAFLEELGCRWFFPAKEWEVIPNKPSLFAIGRSREPGEDSRPKILARRIWYGYGPFPDDKKHPLGGSCLKDYEDWARHNRMASSFRVYAGHAWQTIIANNKAEFDAHPEYLALVKDKREGPQMCVSNPAVKEFAVKWCLDFFAKNPDREMVSLDCSDGERPLRVRGVREARQRQQPRLWPRQSRGEDHQRKSIQAK
jgi:hypothetical protein